MLDFLKPESHLNTLFHTRQIQYKIVYFVKWNPTCFRSEDSSTAETCNLQISVPMNIVTWRLEAGIWLSVGRRFAEYIPLAKRNRHFLGNGLINKFPRQRICLYKSICCPETVTRKEAKWQWMKQNKRGKSTVRLGDLYLARMKLAQSEIQTGDSSRFIRQTPFKGVQ
jgi:hypothetical protein